MLEKDPPYGICAWPVEDRMDQLEAQIRGPEDSPYEAGVFKLLLDIPNRYPFEPPKVKFITPIYHPNIDNGGRICLDTLKMPPKGSWSPSINISTVLTTVRLLMANPNPKDGLMADITQQYTNDRQTFDITAKQWTAKYACRDKPTATVKMDAQEGKKDNNLSRTEPGTRVDVENHDTRNLTVDDESKAIAKQSKPCSPASENMTILSKKRSRLKFNKTAETVTSSTKKTKT
eukprot:439272-Amorphochlora_amoeboformis.AAC.2